MTAVAVLSCCLCWLWHFTGLLPILCVLQSYSPYPAVFPTPSLGSINVSLRPEPSTLIYSQCPLQPWVSAFTFARYKERLIWLKLGVAFVCRYKHQYFEGSFALSVHLNSGRRFPARADDFLNYRILMGLHTRHGFPSVEWTSNAVMEWFVTP